MARRNLDYDTPDSLVDLLRSRTRLSKEAVFSFVETKLSGKTFRLSDHPDDNEKTTCRRRVEEDRTAFEKLGKLRVINFCRTVQLLHPVVSGTGFRCADSLTHFLDAVVMATWGPTDVATVTMYLRNIVDDTMSNATFSASESPLVRRWKASSDVIRSGSDVIVDNPNDSWSSDEWRRQWPSTDQLVPMHIFVVSNALCRPVVVLTANEEKNRDADVSGVYLPLLHAASSCSRYPIIIVSNPYDDNEFQALLSRHPSPPGGAELAVPLVTHRLEPLTVRCLLDVERPELLLETYLRTTELPFTTGNGINIIPCARLDPEVHESVDDEAARRDAVARQRETPSALIRSGMLLGGPTEQGLCRTTGCKFYGLQEYNGQCHACFRSSPRSAPASPVRHDVLASTSRSASASPTHRQLPKKQCINAGCPRLGCEPYGWKCPQCYVTGHRPTAAERHVSFDTRQIGPHAVRAFDDTPTYRGGQQLGYHVHTSTGVTAPLVGVAGERYFDTPPNSPHHVTVTSNNYITPAATLYVVHGDTTATRCSTEGCFGQVSDPDLPLCNVCVHRQQQAFEQLATKRNRVPTVNYYCTAPTPVESGSRLAVELVVGDLMTAQLADRCRNLTCDRFGDAAYDGYCSACYSMTTSRH